MRDYEKIQIDGLVNRLKSEGFQVFIAKRGTYGFYCWDYSKVVSFQCDLGGINFSGNYQTNKAGETGTGWRLRNDTYQAMINCYPPIWAVKDSKWQFKTVRQYLKTYQKSSLFKRQ